MASRTAAANSPAGSVRQRFMAPPPPRAPAEAPRWKPLVLEEEEWAEALESIIERDFFPDIPKLQSKLEWLQALRTRDPEVLRLAQQNIAARRAGLRTPIGATPGSFETPGASILRGPFGGGGGMTTYLATPASTPVLRRGPVDGQRDPLGLTHPSGFGGADGRDADGDDGEGGPVRQAPPMSLDRFLAKHTSEDNASFAELLAAMNKRRRAAADARNPPHVQAALLLEDSLEQDHRPTDGFGTRGQEPLRMLVWPHKQKNALFYDGSQQTALALSDAELALRVAGPPKSISHANTRFSTADVARGAGADTPSSVGTPSTDAGEGPRSAAPGDAYGVLATPSLTPGAGGQSPIMTWGDIASTPLRLGDDDMPEAAGGGDDAGPSFHIASNRRKEEVGRRMAVQAGAALKRRATGYRGTPLARQAAEAAAAAAAGLQPLTAEERLAGGSLVRAAATGARTPLAGSATPLSPAGRRLMQSIRHETSAGGSDAADRQLRASYRTPAARERVGTPGFGSVGGGTPRLGNAGDMTPELKLQRLRQAALAEKAGAKITDDLLNLD